MSDICRKVYWRHSLSILVFIFILAWPVVPLAKAQSGFHRNTPEMGHTKIRNRPPLPVCGRQASEPCPQGGFWWRPDQNGGKGSDPRKETFC